MTLVDGVGLWCEVTERSFAGQSAIFLDRDGVVVEDTNYLGRAQDVRMLKGAAAAIGRCNQLGIPIVLVTNQSGIGRGYYDWNDFHAVQATLSVALAEEGAHLDAVFACAYHANAKSPYCFADHPWRKPNPGMISAAAERMQLNLAGSWIFGDKSSDLATGRAAALRGGVLITDGQPSGEQTAALALGHERFIVEFARSLAGAIAVPVGYGLACER